MIKKIIGAVILIIAPFLIFAQYKNNTWLLGYDNEQPLPWGGPTW
jgi:hypothetical protein